MWVDTDWQGNGVNLYSLFKRGTQAENGHNNSDNNCSLIQWTFSKAWAGIERLVWEMQ
jgi:hypothetical protein